MDPDPQALVPLRPRLFIPGWAHIGQGQMHYHEPTHWWYDGADRTFWHPLFRVDEWTPPSPWDHGEPNTTTAPPLNPEKPPILPYVDLAQGWRWEQDIRCWIDPVSSWWWYPDANIWCDPTNGNWYRRYTMPRPPAVPVEDPITAWFDRQRARRQRHREERLHAKEQRELARQAKQRRHEQAHLEERRTS